METGVNNVPVVVALSQPPGGDPSALAPETVAWLLEQDDQALRALVAHSAGILAHREGGAAPVTVATFVNIAARLRAPGYGRPKMAEIAEQVAASYGISVADLRGRSRLKAFARPRHHFMHDAKAAGYSWNMVGRFLGKRDHSTVAAGIAAHVRRSAVAA